MKILFTGPLLDFSGFAHASRLFLRSMAQDNSVELVARALRYDVADKPYVPEPWLADLLKQELTGIDMVLQMTTCNIEAVPVPGVCNGLYSFFESDRIQQSWVQKANEFDFILVPCKANAEALYRSGVQTQVLVCPPPCDTDVYDKHYPPFEIENAGDRTVFYNVCQLSAKKGIDLLLRAYYAAFADMTDEVLLVLKTYISMGDRSRDAEQVRNYIAAIKQGTRIPNASYAPVLPLLGTLSDDEINGLHKRSHAYVCSSRAEGWGIPVFDALGHSNVVISNMAGGLEGFIRPEHALVYSGSQTFFFDMHNPDPGLFTGVEQCFEPSVVEMSFLMRKYHLLRKGAMHGVLDADRQQEWESVLTRQQNARTITRSFDYRQTTQKILNPLKDAFACWKKTGEVKFTTPTEVAEEE